MLTRWSDIDRTFTIMDELRRRMDWLWDEHDDGRGDVPRFFADVGPRASTWPRLNLSDTGDSLVVEGEIPGLSDKDVSLTINQDVLTLRGERKADAPEGYSVHRQERAAVSFARSFTLPTKIDPEKTTATMKDGVLTITLSKAPEAKPRQITVLAK